MAEGTNGLQSFLERNTHGICTDNDTTYTVSTANHITRIEINGSDIETAYSKAMTALFMLYLNGDVITGGKQYSMRQLENGFAQATGPDGHRQIYNENGEQVTEYLDSNGPSIHPAGLQPEGIAHDGNISEFRRVMDSARMVLLHKGYVLNRSIMSITNRANNRLIDFVFNFQLTSTKGEPIPNVGRIGVLVGPQIRIVLSDNAFVMEHQQITCTLFDFATYITELFPLEYETSHIFHAANQAFQSFKRICDTRLITGAAPLIVLPAQKGAPEQLYIYLNGPDTMKNKLIDDKGDLCSHTGALRNPTLCTKTTQADLARQYDAKYRQRNDTIRKIQMIHEPEFYYNEEPTGPAASDPRRHLTTPHGPLHPPINATLNRILSLLENPDITFK